MQTALAWAQTERDGPYQNSLLKAQTYTALANEAKTTEEICLLEKELDLKCVTIEATLAQSIRENGRVKYYDPEDECKPTELYDEGLKYYQTEQVQADSYRLYADAYRKSGKVAVGIDSTDGYTKGLSGTTHNSSGEAAGYTVQQSANAERQRIGYEDSKINHAANSSSSMIGQMLSSEVAPAGEDVNRWRSAIDKLLTKHSSTAGG